LESICSVIESHSFILDSNSHVFSNLPLYHCFGLILDYLLSIYKASLIYRSTKKDINTMILKWEEYRIDHFSSVPALLEKILLNSKGKEFIDSLQSGIVGGAPISKKLALSLKNSNLRVGYGQSEASPGICLGEKGFFEENYLGKELGCQVLLTEEGELCFKGKNEFLGYWKNHSLSKEKGNDFILTKDLVYKNQNGYYFLGRKDFSFKLDSAYLVHPNIVENLIKDKIKDVQECILIKRAKVELYICIQDSNELFFQLKEILPKKLNLLDWNIIIVDMDFFVYNTKGELNRKIILNKVG
jgi:long-subunit acyl-CoA synthetase (AMP-forming)